MRNRQLYLAVVAFAVAACGPDSGAELDINITSSGLEVAMVTLMRAAVHDSSDGRNCQRVCLRPFANANASDEVSLTAGEPRTGELKLENILSKNMTTDETITYAVMAVAADSQQRPLGFACQDGVTFEDGARKAIELTLTTYTPMSCN